MPADGRSPLWEYAVLAVVSYSWAAERFSVSAEAVARWIAARHHLDQPGAGGPR